MILIALSLLLSFSAQKESYQDMIVKAERLSLQRDRKKALQILNLSLRKQNQSEEAQRKILNSSRRISEIFFQDKVQALYAKARAVFLEESKKENPDYKEAMEVINEALAIEPYNHLLILLKAKIYVYDQATCDDELAYLQEVDTYQANHPSLQFLLLQAHICADVTLTATPKFVNEPTSHGLLKDSMLQFLQKDYAKALNSVGQGLVSDPTYVGFYWIKSEIFDKKEQDKEDLMVEWKSACKLTNHKRTSSLSLNFCHKDLIGE